MTVEPETENLYLPEGKIPQILPCNGKNFKNVYAVQDPLITQVYKKRWLVLLIFNLVSLVNSFQWIEYCIIGNIISKYYGVSNFAVDSTAMVFMVVFLPLMYPASCIMDQKGLRFILILAAGGTCLGSWIKIFSVSPGSFYIGFIGQTIVAISQLFTLSTPARLAATWFGEQQVSTACGLGAMGFQLGNALGFVFTPMIVHDSENLMDIEKDLGLLFWGVAICSTIGLLLVVIFLENEPPTPPSRTQALRRKSLGQITKVTTKKSSTLDAFVRLLKNGSFVSLLITYGVNIGSFCYLSTLLNPIILEKFPGGEEFAGQIGLIFTAIGMISSSVFGFILDKTRKFKETSSVVYLLCTVGVLLFTLSVETESKIIVAFAMLFAGFFLSGYFSVGFEIAAEFSYPELESNSSSFLNFSAQFFGTILTFVGGYVLDNYGYFPANMMVLVLLGIGSVVTLLTPNLRRRQDALKENIANQPDNHKNLNKV